MANLFTTFHRKINYRILILLLCFSIIHVPLQAAFFFSVQSGNWNDPDTWEKFGPGTSQVPGLNDQVVIQSGTVVTLTEDVTIRSLSFIQGEESSSLIHNPNVNLTITQSAQLETPNPSGASYIWNIDGGSVNIERDLIINPIDGSQGSLEIILSTGSLSVEGDFDIDNTNSNNIQINQSTGNSTITLQGDFVNSDQINLTSNPVSTFIYNGVNQLIGSGPSINYGNLTLVNGIKNADDIVDIDGNLLISTSTTFDPATNDVNVAGNWVNNGSFIEENSTVTFDGTQLQLLASAFQEDFFNWIVENSSTGVSIRLENDLTIFNDFQLIDGIVDVNGNQILLTEQATQNFSPPMSGENFISGELIQTIASTDETTLNFPVGENGQMQPIIFTFEQTDATPTQYSAEYVPTSAQSLGLTLPAEIDKVSDIGFWRVQNSGTSLQTGAVTILYNASQVVTDPEFLRVVKSDGSGNWELIANDESGGGSGEPGGSISSNVNFTGLSEFALANAVGGDNPLPVTLLNFEAELNSQNQTEIKWKTSSEKNSEAFFVERSKDGIDYITIQEVKAAGNSNKTLNYEMLDEAPPYGTIYYRLRQVDIDGKTEIFSPVTIEHNKKGQISSEIYPNPTDKRGFNISLNGYAPSEKVDIRVHDMLGNLYFSLEFVTGQGGQISKYVHLPSNIKSGIYFISIAKGSQITKHKFIFSP